MTALDWQGWAQILWVLGVHAVIQGLEGFVITPKIMGDTVGISAIAVLFALLGRRRAPGVHRRASRGARGRGHQDPATAHRRAVPQVRVLRQRRCGWAQRYRALERLDTSSVTSMVRHELARAPTAAPPSMAVPRSPAAIRPKPDEGCVLGGQLAGWRPRYRRRPSARSPPRPTSRCFAAPSWRRRRRRAWPRARAPTSSGPEGRTPQQRSLPRSHAAKVSRCGTVRGERAPYRAGPPWTSATVLTEPVTMVRSSSSAIALRRSRLARTGPAGPSRRTIEPPRVSTSKRWHSASVAASAARPRNIRPID